MIKSAEVKRSKRLKIPHGDPRRLSGRTEFAQDLEGRAYRSDRGLKWKADYESHVTSMAGPRKKIFYSRALVEGSKLMITTFRKWARGDFVRRFLQGKMGG